LKEEGILGKFIQISQKEKPYLGPIKRKMEGLRER